MPDWQILSVAWAIVLVALYALALTATGLLVMCRLRIVDSADDPLPAGMVLGSCFALGSGLFGSAWLLLGAAGWLLAPVVAAAGIMGLCAAYVSRSALGEIAGAGWTTLAAAWRHGSIGDRVVQALTVALIAVFALLSPSQPGADAVAFYLAFAKVTAATGAIAPLPRFESFSEIWMLAELHNAALMVLGSELPARLFTWVASVGLAMSLWGLARSCGLDARGCWIAIAALFTSTGMTRVLWDGKTDLLAAAIGVAAVAWALRLGGERRHAVALVTGLLSGFAVAAKISYLPVLGMAVAVVAGWRLVAAARQGGDGIRGAIGRSVPALLVLACAAALAVAPQIVRNALVSGEPLAPFLYSHRVAVSVLDQEWYSPATTRWLVATYPLVLVYGRYWAQHGTLSPIVLAFLPVAVVWLRTQRQAIDRRLLLVTAAGLLAMATWVILRPSVIAPRYFLGPLLLLLPFASAGAAAATLAASRILRWIAAAAVPVVLVTAIAAHYPYIGPALSYAWHGAGSVSSPEWSILTDLNQRAAPGDRIYLAMWYRYALRPDLIQCLDRSGDPRPAEASSPAEALWSGLHEQGMRFLVYDRATHRGALGVEPDPGRAPPGLRVRVIHTDERFSAYELQADGDAPPPRLACRESAGARRWTILPTTR